MGIDVTRALLQGVCLALMCGLISVLLGDCGAAIVAGVSALMLYGAAMS